MRDHILGLTTPLMAIVFAALFIAIWWRAEQGRHVLAFGLGYVAFALGFMVTHFMPTGGAFTYFATHFFYSVSSAFLIWGTCERAGRSAHLGILCGIYAVSCLSLIAVVSLSDEVGPRMILLNGGYAMMFLVAFVSLMGTPRRSIIDTAILFVLALHTIDFAVRPLLTALAEGSIPAEEYRQSIYYSVIHMALTMKSLNTAIVLIGACVYDLVKHVRQGADIDALTGLRNRRAFEADIAPSFVDTARNSGPVSLIIADIDHFKQVNDVWGHQAGDKAIASLGRLLAEMCRESDVVGRVGGEEFCILVKHCGEDDAARLGERIRFAFAQMIHAEIGDHIRLTASFGVAERGEGESYDRLFSRADAALYAAKDGGRNKVHRASTLAKPDVAKPLEQADEAVPAQAAAA